MIAANGWALVFFDIGDENLSTSCWANVEAWADDGTPLVADPITARLVRMVSEDEPQGYIFDLVRHDEIPAVDEWDGSHAPSVIEAQRETRRQDREHAAKV